MGILDLHIHEPEFNVAPRKGRRSTTESLQKEASEMMSNESEEKGGGSMGAILALAVIVGAAIAIQRFRKSGGEQTGRGGRSELAEIGE